MSTKRTRDCATIGEKVAFLSRPSAYGLPPGSVQVRETHMSWVFLAGDRAYKLKKPVRFPFLDFSTVAAREADCQAEMRLNRRLAPDVYLGMVPLTSDAHHGFALDGGGEVVDWLVMMRRLPDERMLHNAILRGVATREQVQRVAGLLAGFYRNLGPAELSAEKYVSRFARQHVNNRALLEDRRLGLAGPRLNRVLTAIDAVLARDPELLASRVREGRIVEGHGDLRPEHVCLNEPPVIIDCLEFNRAFRLVDPVDELSALGMECARLGARWIGDMLIERCVEVLDDHPSKRLIAFYTAYRACLRARLALAHLLDSQIREPEKWRPLARAYLDLADRACVSLCPPGEPRENHPRGSTE